MLSHSTVWELRHILDTQLELRAADLRAHAHSSDPIQLLHEYTSPLDQEIVGLLASSLAYGQRKVFIPVIRQVLREMGASPYEFVTSGEFERHSFSWFKYRFNRPEDLRCLFHGLRVTLDKYGSLESAFVIDSTEDRDLRQALQLFVGLFRELDFTSIGEQQGGSPGFHYLLPDPIKGGACKRLNMFLRWMVRSDDIDLGIWSGLPSSKLVVPLDVHVQRVSRRIGLTTLSGSSWRVAEDITAGLRQLDPRDPLKYDFLLFSLGAWDERLPNEISA